MSAATLQLPESRESVDRQPLPAYVKIYTDPAIARLGAVLCACMVEKLILACICLELMGYCTT
jgi:hypothetical protein